MATIPSSLENPLITGVSGFRPWYTPQEMLELGVMGGMAFYYEGSRHDIPEDFFTPIDPIKWESPQYSNLGNYFTVTVTARNRNLQAPPSIKMKHAHWLHWYTRYHLGLEIDTYINSVRINQWQQEISTFAYYIRTVEYTPPSPNPENYTRWTDPNFQKDNKQYLLEFGWDPTKDPLNYGFK